MYFFFEAALIVVKKNTVAIVLHMIQHMTMHRSYSVTIASVCLSGVYVLIPLFFTSVSIIVQNGAVTQKDSLNDEEFEPYLNTQARQVIWASHLQ